ncbi:MULTISPECIES: hypothetical protein [unclassified Marinobacter]|jgi:hypothetical protein|uniref:hypothetical protein n=1 Tax=unclassified Marinobacter TaxID=83889 RepID=UPI00201056B6|nr:MULTISPECIES: hypothetical protein [unclassified Marinobacter]MCL1483660.1 hypothetical protein [Marinobacter sp.]UQG56692.1 hypothetical protein MIH16_03195 [Marinobacter sp. M4C]UQG65496.1 hypothetical protein MIH17_03195 [Marinobacter sp. M2C]UQG69776.1 hypothetical protein MIH19_03190 [Marinobacter sp. M1C]
MKQLPKRGPVVLWTGPGESRLVAELFEAEGQLVVMRAFWPEADSPPAATMVDPARIEQEGNEGAPWLIYAMPEDADPALKEQWAKWLKRRDQEGTTREDARRMAQDCLDIDIKEVNGDTVELR